MKCRGMGRMRKTLRECVKNDMELFGLLPGNIQG